MFVSNTCVTEIDQNQNQKNIKIQLNFRRKKNLTFISSEDDIVISSVDQGGAEDPPGCKGQK